MFGAAKWITKNLKIICVFAVRKDPRGRKEMLCRELNVSNLIHWGNIVNMIMEIKFGIQMHPLVVIKYSGRVAENWQNS